MSKYIIEVKDIFLCAVCGSDSEIMECQEADVNGGHLIYLCSSCYKSAKERDEAALYEYQKDEAKEVKGDERRLREKDEG